MLKIRGHFDTSYSEHNIVNPSSEPRPSALTRIIDDVKGRGYELTGMDYAEIYDVDSSRTKESPVIMILNRKSMQHGVIFKDYNPILKTRYMLYLYEPDNTQSEPDA